VSLSDYERRALEAIKARKDEKASQQRRRVIPKSMTDRVTATGEAIRDRAERVPGFEKTAARARDGYLQAVSGMGRIFHQASGLTLSEKRLLKAYARRGYRLTDLAEIRTLDLHTVEKRVMPNYLPFVYSSIAAVEGGASGLFVTGGEAVAAGGDLAGAGAGAVPGVTAVATTVAIDAATVLALCTRVVNHTAMYYGYDPREPGEAVFALGIVSLGSALTQSGKYSAYAELSQITQLLARNASWASLNDKVLTVVIQRFAAAFGVRLTKRKLGQLIPGVGIVVGAGSNFFIVSQVAEAAYWTYRERFLNEKQGVTTLYVPTQRLDYAEPGEVEPDVPIDLLGIVDEAISAGGPTEDPEGSDGGESPSDEDPDSPAPLE